MLKTQLVDDQPKHSLSQQVQVTGIEIEPLEARKHKEPNPFVGQDCFGVVLIEFRKPLF